MVMKRFVDTVVNISLFAILFIAMQLVAVVAVRVLPVGDNSELVRLVAYTISMLLTLVVVKWYMRKSGVERVVMRKASGLNPIVILSGVVILISLSVLLSPLNELLPADSREFGDSTWTLIMVVAVAPIFEEILFRGMLYNLLRVTCPPFVAVLISSILFGVIHLEPTVIVEGVLVGLLFSYVYLRTKSILAPITLHVCNNIVAYALAILSYQEMPLLESVNGDAYFAYIYSGCALVVVVTLAVIVRFFIKYRGGITETIKSQNVERV